MFDIGFWELFLILILALLVVGPERLPKAARTAGYWFGKARRYVEGARDELANEFDVGELKRMIHNQEVQINELQNQLKHPIGFDDVNRDPDDDEDEDEEPQYEIIEEKKVSSESANKPAENSDDQADKPKE